MNAPDLPNRKNLRLRDYDYSQPNYYYVTICTKEMRELFWKRRDKNIVTEKNKVQCRGAHCASEIKDFGLSNIGKVVDKAINLIPKKYEAVYVDKYTIMPNHIHIIIVIKTDENGRAMRAPTLSTVLNQLKGYVTKQVNIKIWQKGFYEEIIRNENGYQHIWEYIDTNPQKWLNKYYTKANDITE